MITYTVFDPDDGSGSTYWWYGESMVYVHQDGVEVDAFELDPPEGDAPRSIESVRSAVDQRHARR